MQTIDQDMFVARITQCIFQRRGLIEQVSQLKPGITDYFSTVEATIFVSQLLILMLRGASADDCTRYVDTRSTTLPFEGCEQRIFDELLAAVAERANIDRTVTALVDGVSAWMAHALETVEQEIGVSRTSIIPMVIEMDLIDELDTRPVPPFCRGVPVSTIIAEG